MSKRSAIFLLSIAALVMLLVGSVNYFNLQRTMWKINEEDPRNEGIKVFVHYRYFLDTSALIYDIREIPGTASPLDVTRVLIQFAAQKKGNLFEEVQLQHNGAGKFILSGEYFKKLGEEYGTQNPTYTLRTLPENLLKLDGSHAFGTWTRGMLGVLGKQMDDFATWHHDWYIDDLTNPKDEKETNGR